MSEQQIDAVMEAYGLSIPDGAFIPEQGNLNTVRFVKDKSGRELVLRIHKDLKREDTSSYLETLYRSMGLDAHQGQVNFRTTREQVQALKHFSDLGIPVPEIIDYGTYWMLMSKAKGVPLKDLLGDLPRESLKEPINAVLSAAMEAHKQGVCLWDRWGANELLDAEGNVSFIDFDIEVLWPDSVPNKVRTAFDLAVLLRGCIQFATDKTAAGKLVAACIYNNLDFEEIYDTQVLAGFLEGQVEFYVSQYCLNDNASQFDRTLHDHTNEEIMRLSRMTWLMPKPSHSTNLQRSRSSIHNSFASIALGNFRKG